MAIGNTIKDTNCYGYKQNPDNTKFAFLKYEIEFNKGYDSASVCDPLQSDLSIWTGDGSGKLEEAKRIVNGSEKVQSFRWIDNKTISYEILCESPCESSKTVKLN